MEGAVGVRKVLHDEWGFQEAGMEFAEAHWRTAPSADIAHSKIVVALEGIVEQIDGKASLARQRHVGANIAKGRLVGVQQRLLFLRERLARRWGPPPAPLPLPSTTAVSAREGGAVAVAIPIRIIAASASASPQQLADDLALPDLCRLLRVVPHRLVEPEEN